MRRFLAGIAFLSRIPVPGAATFDGGDVGRATLFFPLVGALLGAVMVVTSRVFAPALPPSVTAFLVLGVGALVTGALHLDGLADMADGFGGGRTREDTLRIMRDHAIGSYGTVALILVIGLKASVLAELLERGAADHALIVAPALARWATVPLGRFLPYARKDAGGGLGGALGPSVGWLELAGATLLAAGISIGLLGATGALALAAVSVLSVLMGALCLRKIGGMTGDTLGANTEASEALVLLLVLGGP